MPSDPTHHPQLSVCDIGVVLRLYARLVWNPHRLVTVTTVVPLAANPNLGRNAS